MSLTQILDRLKAEPEWTAHHEKGELGLSSIIRGKDFVVVSISSYDANRLISEGNATRARYLAAIEVAELTISKLMRIDDLSPMSKCSDPNCWPCQMWQIAHDSIPVITTKLAAVLEVKP